MRALIILFVLMPFSFAQAKLVDGDSSDDLGRVPYIQVLNALKSKARGLEGDRLIEGLNKAYRELSPDGKSNPSFAEVARRAKVDGGLPDGRHAELITLCVIGIVGGLAAGSAYVMSDRKLGRVVRTMGGDGPTCPRDRADLLNSARGQSQTAAASGGAAAI